MPNNIINATSTGSGGLITTAADSGSLELQSDGTTIATLSSTGLTMAAGKKVFSEGSVLQVVNVTYSTYTSTSGTTYVDTGLSASITPSSASNKVLVIVHQSECTNSNSSVGFALQLLRTSTSLIVVGPAIGYGVSAANASISTAYLDSPATTSSVTYKTQFKLNSATGIAAVQNDSATSTITLMEIKG